MTATTERKARGEAHLLWIMKLEREEWPSPVELNPILMPTTGLLHQLLCPLNPVFCDCCDVFL